MGRYGNRDGAMQDGKEQVQKRNKDGMYIGPLIDDFCSCGEVALFF
jgi:hypothetical protein